MADNVRRVDYYEFDIDNKPGTGAQLLGRIRDSGINLLALWGYAMGDKGKLGVVPSDSAGFADAAKDAGLAHGGATPAFFIAGSDRMGAIAEHLDKLAAAGINVEAAQAATDNEGRFGALICVADADVAKAAAALGAS